MLILRMLFILVLSSLSSWVYANDPLPSWNEGKNKQAIIEFVEKVTKKNSKDYVPPAERLATFDNDGTLWVEHPMYTQLAFALDQVKVLAPQHPEWQTQQPFKAILEDDLKGFSEQGEKAIVELIMATHAGMSPKQFDDTVSTWLETAKHPRFQVPYTQLVYKPMVELLHYLRDNEFKTYIVSGGGIEFIRPWAEKAYGIPPEQVIGSSIKLKYELNNNKPGLLRLPESNFVDNGPGKPIAIQERIGRRPIAAFGNSDGDFEMLDWTTSGEGARLGMIVHHDDAAREYAYDRDTHTGMLKKALDEAPSHHWNVISMKNDWKVIFGSNN